MLGHKGILGGKGPYRGCSFDGLGEVAVERRFGDGLESPKVTGGPAVELRDAVVGQGEEEDDGQHLGEGVA
jgi:hypothetical protein